MSTEALIEVLRAHLLKEGLCLCRAPDTQFPLDGFKETVALREIVHLLDDANAVPEWAVPSPGHTTAPIPADTLAALRAAG